MPINKLYPKAFAGVDALRRTDRAGADINYRLLNQAVRQWRTNNLNEEDLRDILTTAANGELISPNDPRFLAGE